ncbi:hypothetical protein AOR01nite_23290 [Acetobacter orleanensis]|uniref:Arc-like DNA binding domain-containing protein n=2 Tax=Acetobacter orleanensis TaxID=104099 RepID=A0A4Y3TPZ2_9PROT|nr:hypothetical protein Abol_015_173 [Acetobacter orleanensis JCM 7639]GEB83852.1 hypothetical protein AOR01nite_23290 [Acetobacter orleanensis]
MAKTRTFTMRIPEKIRDYLHQRAIQNGRSMNGEVLRILRDLEEIEMASGAKLGGSSPDAGTTKCGRILSSASG